MRSTPGHPGYCGVQKQVARLLRLSHHAGRNGCSRFDYAGKSEGVAVAEASVLEPQTLL
jgi:hypothetical protein